MSLVKYIKDKILYILVYEIYCLFMVLYLDAINVGTSEIILITAITTFIAVFIMFLNYNKKNRIIKELKQTIDKLDEKYLIGEIMKKPSNCELLEYYKILKLANKSMLDKIAQSQRKQKEYKEYIESWVHEIKLPITSIDLYCNNNRNNITRKIIEENAKINNYVEQALFYARLDSVSNDYMIKKTSLNECVNNVISKNKNALIQNKIKIEIEDLDIKVYTDEKWLEFILNQIVINSIKYKSNSNGPIISIYQMENKENVCLYIKDNGIGIKSSEINRVFEKGFTGTNGRRNIKSTGIGLFLCLKLCDELGLVIQIESSESEYTIVKIIIPKYEYIR